MPSLLVTATGQALVLGVASNVLAQIISAQQEGVREIHSSQRLVLTNG